MPERFVAVYHDEGSGEFSRGALTHALALHFARRAHVRRIYAAEISGSDAWHEGTTLLALPGGADLPYCAKLDGPGNASIQRYLHAGGALVGMCAGAYYACARVAFEAQRPDAITGQRELALFAGTARGSLHELAAPYAVGDLRCADVVRLRAPGCPRDLAALYWGGPEFLPDPAARYTPLLRYVTPDARHPLAAVRVEVGLGRAVLCGVHAEVRGDQLAIEVGRHADDSFEHGMRVSAALSSAEQARQQLWDHLLAAVGFEP